MYIVHNVAPVLPCRFPHLALLATLKEAALLHKGREQAAVVPAHSASVFADVRKSLSARWLRGRGSEMKKRSRSNQPHYPLGQRAGVGGG